MIDNILDLKGWSVNGWSIQQYLLTLKLGLFNVGETTNLKEMQNKCFFAECSFNKPSRINFHHFTADNSSFIQEILVTSVDGRNKNHRFILGKNSLIEIIAPDYSIIKW